MRRIARFLIRLYPAWWRARYGDEFQALLEDAPPRWSSLFDLLGGATKMQFSNLKFTRLAVSLSLLGLLAGIGVSYLFTPMYVSSAELMMTPGTDDGLRPQQRDLKAWLIQLENEILSRTSLSQIIQDPRLDLYAAQRKVEPLEDVIETMRTRDLKITLVPHPGLATNNAIPFSLRYQGSNPHKLQAVVQTIITKLQEANIGAQRGSYWMRSEVESDEIQRLQARVTALERRLGIVQTVSTGWPERSRGLLPSPAAISLTVIDAPSYPELPAKPNRAIFAAFGFGGGFALAAVATLVRRKPSTPIALPACFILP